jgi:hypothetical protein
MIGISCKMSDSYSPKPNSRPVPSRDIRAVDLLAWEEVEGVLYVDLFREGYNQKTELISRRM